MVCQPPPAGADRHIVHAVGVKDRLCRLGAGQAPAVVNGAVPAEIPADLGLGPEGEKHHRDQQNAVDVVGKKISVIVVIRHRIPRFSIGLDVPAGRPPRSSAFLPGPGAPGPEELCRLRRRCRCPAPQPPRWFRPGPWSPPRSPGRQTA